MNSMPRDRTVLLFAAARDRVGEPSVAVPLAPEATVGDLRAALCETFPSLRALGGSLLIAIDEHYVSDADVIPEDAEIACFPPVSGG